MTGFSQTRPTVVDLRSKPSARVIPLPGRAKKLPLWVWIAAGTGALLTIVAAALAWWWLREEPPQAVLDVEQKTAYVEVITPPPADVVAPAPVIPAPPGSAPEPLGIAIPLESLRLPPPPPADGITIPAASDSAVQAVAERIAGQAGPRDAGTADSAGRTKATIRVTERETAPPARSLADAHALAENNDDDAALAAYQNVLEDNPASRAALEGKAYLLQRAGRLDESARAWRQLLRLKPRHAPAEAALAKILAAQNLNDEALDHAARAAADDPANPLYRLDLAILHDRRGDVAEAASHYRAALAGLSRRADNAPPLPFSLSAIARRTEYLDRIAASIARMAEPEK